ncbi:HET-domain-containing protein, partial [Mytilinidion resinicola]
MNSNSKKEIRHRLTEGISSLFNRSGVYTPLKNETSIRLLRIKGDHGAGVLRCTMTEADLDDNPVYEALSYTWQKDQSGFLEVVSLSSRIGKVAKQWEKLSNIGVGNETIICNDQYLKVTPNLHDALLHLRRRSRRRTAIWIDAICIDQSNVHERNAQVNMMGRIFDSARQVVVWLGKATE